MTPENEKFLQELKDSFCEMIDKKFRRGVKEHGGNLWEKKWLAKEAMNETLDQYTYLFALMYQIKKSGVHLGSKEDK